VILTTEKDLVKIEPAWFRGAEEKLYALRAGIDMPGMTDVIDEIERLAENRRIP
jgi:tetraacyldisaccharide-1-P 4'-kinase